MSGRRVCEKCGSSYHLLYKKPAQEGICTNCGGTLVQRKDDHPDTVNDRLRVYHEQTEPLVEYYSKLGLVREVVGQDKLEDTTRLTMQALGADV
jgi:adenylate kinase